MLRTTCLKGEATERNNMKLYKDLSGNSNVISYELGTVEVRVKFDDDSLYLYTTQSTGAVNINEMQRLASNGQGLNSFIGRIVKMNYAEKIQ